MNKLPAFTISSINERDFDQLYQIEKLAHSLPWSLGTLKNNQGEPYINFKLVAQGKIIAFCICQAVIDEATLFNIAVHPNWQGQGFGKALLQHLIHTLTEKHIATLWLEVRESNLSAQKLYEKLGFNQVDKRKNYYPTHTQAREDAIVMALYL